MKILITGAKGQVGRELALQGPPLDFEPVLTDIEELDITDPAAVAACIRANQARLVVNAAAYTAVDLAESNREIAFRVNRDGPATLAGACADAGIPLVHISTDYVYDGRKRGPYVESDPVAPLGAYAESKAAGDAAVTERLERHIILRTAWLYSVHGRNFVKTMLGLGRERETLAVVDDQVGCPTSAEDLVATILEIAGQLRQGRDMPWGLYHYCGRGDTSWCGFARAIFDLARSHETLAVQTVRAITTAEYPTPARRPANSVLDCAKIREHLGIETQPWRDSLARTIAKLYA